MNPWECIDMSKKLEAMSVEELKAELKRLRENLEDFEEMHTFTMAKTSVHIGANQANALQEEYEDEIKTYNAQIAQIEALLASRSGV